MAKINLNSLAKAWSEGYGEDLINDYSGVYDALYQQFGENDFDLADLVKAWESAYGEDFRSNYSGVYQDLGGKRLISYIDEEGNPLESYIKGGTFVDEDYEIVEDPNDEEFEMGFGKETFSPSDFMGNKIKTKLIKK